MSMPPIMPFEGIHTPQSDVIHPPKRRKRPGPTLRACVPCRNQKLRCNKSENPCSHCQRRGIDCYYESKERTGRYIEGSEENQLKPSQSQTLRQIHNPSQQPNHLVSSSSSSSSTTSSDKDARLQQQELFWASRCLAQYNRASYRSTISSTSPATMTISPLGSLPSTPSFSQPAQLWFDHLLSFFGPNRQSNQRMVTFLLNNAFTHSHYFWFDMWHLPTIRRAGYSEREREYIHPALVYGMVAVSLRQRQSRRRAYGMGVGETMIPDETIPPPMSSDDLSEQIKEAANTFLEQDLSTPDRNLRSWLDTAKAALMLMQLENELSPRYLHLLGIARTVLRSTNLKEAIQAEAKVTTGNQFQDSPIQKRVSEDVSRTSIEMEEAARLALLPLWLGTRTGMAYFNVEINQNGFTAQDVSEAFVFAPWPDGQPEESQKKSNDASSTGTLEREEMSSNMRARILGLNVMYTNFLARSLPYDIDYTNPSNQFKKSLRNLDDAEFMFQMMSEVVDWLEPSFFRMMMIRFCTSVCYLHGVLIRRLGFAHSDPLRQAVIAKLMAKKQAQDSSGGEEDSGTRSTTTSSSNKSSSNKGVDDDEGKRPRFESAILRGWCRVQQIYMTEMDLDHISANGQGHLLQMTKFQSDVIRLYWLGTQQFYLGVKKTLLMIDVDPKKDELAIMLNKTIQDLAMRIKRHDKATKYTISSTSLGHALASKPKNGMAGEQDSSEDSVNSW